MIEGTNGQEDTIILNLHAPRTGCKNGLFSVVSVTAKVPVLRTNDFKILHIIKKAVLEYGSSGGNHQPLAHLEILERKLDH